MHGSTVDINEGAGAIYGILLTIVDLRGCLTPSPRNTAYEKGHFAKLAVTSYRYTKEGLLPYHSLDKEPYCSRLQVFKALRHTGYKWDCSQKLTKLCLHLGRESSHGTRAF